MEATGIAHLRDNAKGGRWQLQRGARMKKAGVELATAALCIHRSSMKTLLMTLFLSVLTACSQTRADNAQAEAARRLATGEAVLVDVREPREWAQTGVAAPAVLLAKSSLDSGGSDWKAFLDANQGKEIILMCRSGNRSGQVARVLEARGIKTTNLGGFADWKKAGLPTRDVRKEEGTK